MTDKKLLIIFGIIALTIMAYSNSFFGTFLYDDRILIPGGFIKSLDFNELFGVVCGQVFPDGTTKGALYRPALILSYFIDYRLWQENAFGYHLSNLILHIANCVILFYLILLLTGSINISSITAALFSVHPVQVESVTWIAGRNDLMMSLFILLALLFYLRNKLILSWISFFVAVFTKETAIFLFVLFLLYDAVFRPEAKRAKSDYAGFAAAIIAYLFIRLFVVQAPGPSGGSDPLIYKFFDMPIYYLNYLKLLFYPAVYSFIPPLLFAGSLKLLYATTTVIALILLYHIFKKTHVLRFGLLWFLICLLPCSGIISMPWPLMEHRLYLPSVGIFLCAAYGINTLITNRVRAVRAGGLIIMILIMSYFTLATHDRNDLFSSEEKVWESTLKANPQSVAAQKLLLESRK